MAGKFITFEGGEGTGKSTQIDLLRDRLAATGRKITVTREPGGTATAEAIRRLILSGAAEQMGPEGEAILFAAARADHVEKVIRPALAAGEWVLCDRFFDSTHVYQGVAGGVDDGLLLALDRVAVGRTRPHLTFILDLPASVGLARARQRRREEDGEPDRFEREDAALHEKRRAAFIDLALAEPKRCVVIDADRPAEAIADEIWQVVSTRFLSRAA